MSKSTNDDLIVYRGIFPKYGARGGILSYSEEMHYNGLKEDKLLTSREIGMLESKINHQAKVWGEKWQKKLKLNRIN